MSQSTGNELVDAFGTLRLEGNVIPHNWNKHILMENGKPDLVGMFILSDIVFWYRPSEEADEETGNITTKKKFKADLLQRSYDQLTEKLGITKRQAQDAVKRLEDRGLVQRHLRTIELEGGRKVSNVLFLEPIFANVFAITTGLETPPIQVSGQLSRYNGIPSHVKTGHPIPLKRETYTEITNTEISIQSVSEGKSKTKKAAPTPTPKKVEPEKRLFGETVYLSEAEYERLLKNYGQERLEWMIWRLDLEKQEKPDYAKKIKSDNATLQKWVATAWEEDQARRSRMNPQLSKRQGAIRESAAPEPELPAGNSFEELLKQKGISDVSHT